MTSLPALRALHINPATKHIEVVAWDQTLGQLYDWIGYGHCWFTDHGNRIYYVPPEDSPEPGTINHARWPWPLRGSALIVSMENLSGDDAPLSLNDCSKYQRQLRLTP